MLYIDISLYEGYYTIIQEWLGNISTQFAKGIVMNYEMEKIYEISAELDSYNALFSAYINQHEDIPEMLHLSLISDKIQEKINELKNITKNI